MPISFAQGPFTYMLSYWEAWFPFELQVGGL